MMLQMQHYQKILHRQKQMQKMKSFMSQEYNKALFTLSYLVSLQLRKYMELFNSLTKMNVEDLKDSDIME